MTHIEIRPAALDDTQAICALFRARIPVWQRIDPEGLVQDVPYERLTIYERWLHGGPWMSIETGVLYLSHLLRGAGLAMVAVDGEAITGYCEAYHSVEPEPFGDHLHLSARIGADPDTGRALVQSVLEQAAASGCQRVTVSCVAHDDQDADFYQSMGMQPLTRIRRVQLPAKTGQVFYKSVEHLSANPAQISDWYMPLGRWENARHAWETLWPRTWWALPELRRRRSNRLHLTAAGQEAFVYVEQQLYAPRNADVSCWTPKPLPGQILTALRDWAHREGYRTLVFGVTDDVLKILGPEAEPDGYYRDLYHIPV